MKSQKKLFFLELSALAVILFLSCAGQEGNKTVIADSKVNQVPVVSSKNADEIYEDEIKKSLRLLDEMAELERTGIYLKGVGFTECELLEKTGNYPGALLAFYKELSNGYGHGERELSYITDIMERMLTEEDLPDEENVRPVAQAIYDFLHGRWEEAEKKLSAIFTEDIELDSFCQFMILSCKLEKNPLDKKTEYVYRAIRTRYSFYPEYWYRGARLFTGNIAIQFAENCINLAPNGPFTPECRNLLAALTGLNNEDGFSIKSTSEIENLISNAVNTGNPEILNDLLPLINLPENPFTMHAINALKPLAFNPVFNDYFKHHAALSSGRLAERLTYLSRN
ncbi:MAG: hypothetical protein FWH41_07865 [Treponema sp.]|nr:hypothetical protein [Treponema sp.]